MVIVAAIGALAVATAAVLAFTRPNRQENAAGELFLDPAAGTGADPFTTGSAGTLPPPPAPAPAPAPAPSLPPATVRTPGSTAIQAISGATPGLYGGTLNNSSCNRDQLVVFLQQNPNRAAAWVAALNSDPGLRWAGGVSLRPTDIADYVAELTPLILRVDTRVTNHGFVDGSPTPRQTVLQAGTAVLVDRLGIPRVRCYCGNPLLPPHPISSRVRNRGNPWPNYTSSSVIVVQQSVTVINNFTVINVADNMTFQRPAGSTGTLDASTAPTPTATPTPTAVPTPLPVAPSATTTASKTPSPPASAAWLYDLPGSYTGAGPSGQRTDTPTLNSTTQWVGCDGTPATLTVQLPTGARRFTAIAELRPGTPVLTVRMTVSVDGRALSEVTVTEGRSAPIDVDVSGGSALTLAAAVTTGQCGSDSTGYGVWGSARVS